MADHTNIEWADSTFNPFIGCTKISPACDNCYAEELMDKRMHRVQWGAGQPRVRTSAGNWKKPLQWNAKPFCECPSCGWRGEQSAAMRGCDCPSCMQSGVLVSARRRVFCASLADVFDNDVSPEWRADLFELIEATPNLDWMLLTKRIGNVPKMLRQILRLNGLPPNVWIGTTICNQDEADRDIPKLLDIPAAVRFLSMEPLLGPVNLPGLFYYGTERTGGVVPLRDRGHTQLDWVIVGGESGPNARPMHPDWPRALRDQCAAAGAPFLFKQWGEWGPDWEGATTCGNCGNTKFDCASTGPRGKDECGHCGGEVWLDADKPLDSMCRVGKKAAGRMLDGVQHDGYPKGGAA